MATTPDDDGPTISLPPNFHFSPADRRLKTPSGPGSDNDRPPLGVLDHFTGSFTGQGFNTIFRPHSDSDPQTTGDNILELNLTVETIDFSRDLGDVPNRGLGAQPDISLNGVPYIQRVRDMTDISTGTRFTDPTKGVDIHFEPGLWMHVPATTSDPNLAESLSRMASIPHGTTINAQAVAPSSSSPGPPPLATLPPVDITPFSIGNPSQKIRFPSQKVDTATTTRLPNDLANFIKAGTITQSILDNPQLVLANAIKGQKITNTFVFTVRTKAQTPFLLGGGTANIEFLEGANVGTQANPNADAIQMEATFWIETVQATIQVPVHKKDDPPVLVTVPAASPGGQAGPTFKVAPPKDITKATNITVTFTQIQYIQTVLLNFANLTWPHVSCATLVPKRPLPVPASAFP